MKRKSLSLLLALAMVFSLAIPVSAAEAADTQIVILHTNDVHCGIDQTTDEETGAVTNIGYAGVAAYKAEMEAQYGADNVILVDGGDAIQGGPIGTLSKGSYIVDIMNQVGYDLAVPGNHEFDYGMDNFLDLAENRAEYPYLCANLTDLEGNPILDAYTLVEAGGVTVAFVGIDTPESFTKSTPTYFQDENGNYIYSFSQGNDGQDLYDAVQSAVDDATAAGADYVVAVGHLGIEGSTEEWKSTSVIANTTGIDVFIDGHSHEAYDQVVQNADGEDVYLAQTGTKLANIGKIVIDTATGEAATQSRTLTPPPSWPR
ncbi:bifunctional UDP-sugar hydrolase/5'-nucleotidase [uncultured Intestinimonas sp.]|uniref:bifunctional metallophosphatase/5'-nucleotidase n=1 Tax=uncultured Intestinimonas sp. TaxID=1689265 RepID=UPI0025D8D24C|nr:metallophosphatase [uncultured Intestinimonas sp.]